MDALSDVLRAVRLNGAVYLDGEFAAPWCVSGRAEAALYSTFLPQVERVLSFHFVTAGSCWARLPGEIDSPIRLVAGDLVVVPQGETHILGSAADLAPDTPGPVVAEHIASAPGKIMKLSYGGDGDVTRLVCGFLGAENVQGNPLLGALPRLFKVDMRSANIAWLESSLQFAAQEAAQMRSGSATVLGKLSELLFVEAIRRYIETLPEEQTGWLAGLRDRFVGRALSMMHAHPAYPWTVDDLAKGAGVSRSVLALRFSELVGLPPMHYLARWRLQVAAQHLRAGDESLANIAESVGYDSEAAFNRAFKREFGVPPATWRRRRARPGADALPPISGVGPS